MTKTFHRAFLLLSAVGALSGTALAEEESTPAPASRLGQVREPDCTYESSLTVKPEALVETKTDAPVKTDESKTAN